MIRNANQKTDNNNNNNHNMFLDFESSKLMLSKLTPGWNLSSARIITASYSLPSSEAKNP